MKAIIILLILTTSHMAMAQCNMDRHNTSSSTAWESCSPSDNPNAMRGVTHWFEMDLGENYVLGETTIWNYNHPDKLDYGIREVIVDYSMDRETWTELDTFTLAQATGSSLYEGTDGPDLGSTEMRYLLFTVVSNYGDPTCFGLSEIRLNIAESALPISLASLDVTCDQDDANIQVEWQTLYEENIDYYLVETSSDTTNWTEVVVKGLGDVMGSDYELLLDITNHSMLRLSSVDFDGRKTELGMTSINCQLIGDLSVNPNPFEDIIEITLESDGPVSYQITDVLGRLISTDILQESGPLDLSHLPNGSYLLSYISKEKKKTEVLLKQGNK